jgi:predicted 2-oxoglutarate/Fe(II)-dependent dioxygenase YbiX
VTLRDNVLIRQNAIGADDLKLLTDYVRKAKMTDSLVSNFQDEATADEVEWVVNKQIRDTQEVKLTSAIRKKLLAIDNVSINTYINPFYQVEVSDREPSLILHYGAGGHYIPHVDAETLYKDDIGLEMWEKTLDRDLSLVYFLNDDFIGGELVFPDLDLVIKPTAGTLVCFPSDHHYVHGVNPVKASPRTSGHRFTIVTWMRVMGTPSIDEINQMNMDEYHRQWPKQIEQPSRLTKKRQLP